MSNVYVVITTTGRPFIVGVFLSPEAAELAIKNNRHLGEMRISNEPVIQQ